MTMLPAQPLPDLATREDVAGLRSEVRVEIDSLRSEMHTEIGSLRNEMHTEIGSLRTEMRAEINSVRVEIRTGFGAVRTEMAAMRTELSSEIQSVEHRMDAALSQQIGKLRGDVVGWILALGAVMITMFAAVITLGLTGAFS